MTKNDHEPTGERPVQSGTLKGSFMTETKNEQTFMPLTGMRGIACLCIMAFHYFCLYFDNLGLGTDALPFAPNSEVFFVYCRNAAELFFMLSGFMIAHQYRDKIASLSIGEYLKKRYIKLLIAGKEKPKLICLLILINF